MRCSEPQDRWHIFQHHREMRICLDLAERLLRSGEMTSACSFVPFPFQFCHFSQCFSLTPATDLTTSHAWFNRKSLTTLSCARAEHIQLHTNQSTSMQTRIVSQGPPQELSCPFSELTRLCQ